MATETTTQAAAAADPWASAAAPADPGTTASSAASTANDWLNVATEAEPFDWLHPFQEVIMPFDQWVETGLNWLVLHGRPVFQAIRVPIDLILTSFQSALVSTPAPIMLLILALIAWQLAGTRMGITSLFSLIIIGLVGAW